MHDNIQDQYLRQEHHARQNLHAAVASSDFHSTPVHIDVVEKDVGNEVAWQPQKLTTVEVTEKLGTEVHG